MLNNATVANKKIAITGAGGFLGSHLLPLLKERKASPKCLVRSQSPELDGVEIIKGDCLDYQSIKHLLEGQDIFIHLAAMLFGSDWQEYLKTNTAIVRNINSALKELPPESRPKKIILVSSLSAAGPCGIAPGKKEDEAPTPVSAYGWSKLYCEEALAQAPVETYTILAQVPARSANFLSPLFTQRTRLPPL